MSAESITVKPLTPVRLADFMAFFEGEAFSDTLKWSSCYCQCFHEDHSKIRWSDRTGTENRECASRRIGRGEMQRLLAYQAGKVVAWCNAAPRTLLQALDAESVQAAEQVGTILCFLVAPRLRGRGIATALLDAACRQLSAQGLRFVEAKPTSERTGRWRKSLRTARHVSRCAIHGPESRRRRKRLGSQRAWTGAPNPSRGV